MEAGQILDASRELLDDRVIPYQFSDEDLYRHLNDAVDEACIRTRVTQDSTSKITQVTLKVDQGIYRLDKSIYAVRRVRLDGEREPLDLVDTSQLDHECPGWDDPTIRPPDRPRYACFDFSTGMIVFVPRPEAERTARMLVWRRPTEAERIEVGDGSAEPALPEHMHRELKHWVAGAALMNPDAERSNPTLSAYQFRLFEDAYGRKPTLHEIRLWSTNRRRHVRACWD